MKVNIEKSFVWDVEKIWSKKILQDLQKIISQMENAGSISEIPHIKK